MAIFCLKKLDKLTLVGDKLKQARKQKKTSLNQAASFLRIPKKYLHALEKNDFKTLPNTKAHQLAYIKKYAKFLRLNTEEITEQFKIETDLKNYKTVHPRNGLKIRPINSIVIWTKRLIITLIVLSFIGYLIWQVNGILRPPKLFVYTPVEGYMSKTLITKVQGETEKEIILTINGKQIQTNERGQFETEIILSKGLNTVTIIAAKKHGKTTTITRNIVVKMDNNG